MSPRRARWLGVAVGVLVPLLAFLVVVATVRASDDAEPAGSVASGIWALVAFTGVVLMAWDRTRPVGVGILLGFSGLVVVGAGTCTAVVMGGWS